jgi:hypothetical protein
MRALRQQCDNDTELEHAYRALIGNVDFGATLHWMLRVRTFEVDTSAPLGDDVRDHRVRHHWIAAEAAKRCSRVIHDYGTAAPGDVECIAAPEPAARSGDDNHLTVKRYACHDLPLPASRFCAVVPQRCNNERPRF